MKLGFVGTGEITSAMVTGLGSCEGVGSIHLSPRNAVIAANLASRFPHVTTACSNQDVLDSCETVVIAVRPQIVRSVLSELRFRPDHRVISIVSALSLRTLFKLVAPATKVTRAVPLPSTAKRLGPTAIYPPDPLLEDLFKKIGTVLAVEQENEFDALCAATATISSYYAFVERIASWLTQKGVSETKAREYIARMFFGLTSTAVDAPERSFQSLAGAHATAGGINEQFLTHVVKAGLLESVLEGLDAVLDRIRAASMTI